MVPVSCRTAALRNPKHPNLLPDSIMPKPSSSLRFPEKLRRETLYWQLVVMFQVGLYYSAIVINPRFWDGRFSPPGLRVRVRV